MPGQSFEHALAYVIALTGSDQTVMDWRAIHDTNKAVEAWTRRGSLGQVWAELCAWNDQGRGIFAMVNATDGLGREVQNVKAMRANFIDIDEGDTHSKHNAAMGWSLKPHFYVQSSAIKYHEYWVAQPYTDPLQFNSIQQRLITLFGSDPPIWDAPRVMRVPGFMHMKDPATPRLVTIHAGPAWGQPGYPVTALEYALAGVVASGLGGGTRENLGDPDLAAPSLEWATRCLTHIDPNQCSRDEWIALTAAFKQAAWSHSDESVVRLIWEQWCAKYAKNDKGENDKQWRSIRSTAAGWNKLLQSSGLFAEFKFGRGPGALPPGASATPHAPGVAQLAGPAVPSVIEPVASPSQGIAPIDTGAAMLMPEEQAEYFKGCTLITKDGRILNPEGRFMDASKFNARYGGKAFIWTIDGKTTDEPWKAATRGQQFRVPQADHIRFLPGQASGAHIVDELGRHGVNTYIPAKIRTIAGDPTRFVQHLRAILPTERDVLILLNFLARIVQSPGVKIPWAPVIQSAEGAGKNVIKMCMTHAVGSVYTYFPKARELAETGGKFNGWMRSRLFILCDEVKTDERRDLIETLKDLISEERVEVQTKGVDQDLEDNFANWIFFTNWEDAIPIDRGSRRWAIFYSQLQTPEDIERAGLNARYYSELYQWIRADGAAIVAHYLKNFAIDPEFDPAINQRAPQTSSTEAAIAKSRTGPEVALHEAIETRREGFKGGWVSSAAVQLLFDELKIKCSNVALSRILDKMGYRVIGRLGQHIVQEGYKMPVLRNLDPSADMSTYKAAQGYPS